MSFLRNIFRRRRVEEHLDDEIRSYVDLLTHQKEHAGLNPSEARRAALLETGGIEVVKEQCRDVYSGAWLIGVLQDARYAFRSLRKSTAFTLVSVLSLALGIGANAAIFGVFYAAFLKPLPYPQAGRLYAFSRTEFGVMTPELVLWRGSARALDVAGWDDTGVTLTGIGTPERLDAAKVSANFLDVLRAGPMIGRGFTEDDGKPAAPMSAILSHEFWQRKFGSDSTVPGRTVLLDGKPANILGVMPADFRFPGNYRPDLLLAAPLPLRPDWGVDTVEGFRVFGRLHDGITPQQALGDLSSLSSQESMVLFLKHWGGARTKLGALPLQESLNGKSRPMLRLLLVAVSLLLLIACVNVASLQLGRAALRYREIGLRTALGAGRIRLARLVVIENLALASLAGLAGLLVAVILLRVLRASVGLPIVGLAQLQPGWMLGLAPFALAAIGGVLVGLAPAILAPRVELNQVLKGGGMQIAGGRKNWIRPVLVGTQVALALVLLLGSGLLVRSLAGVLSMDSGFRPSHLLTARLLLLDTRYKSEDQLRAFVQDLLDKTASLPGVESASVSNTVPLTMYSVGGVVRLEGEPKPERGVRKHGTAIISVTPQYFHTLGMRMLRGRAFDGTERPDGPPVVVINAAAARSLFGTDDVVGRRLQALRIGDDQPWLTITGVVADVRTLGPETEPQSEFFRPISQSVPRRAHIVLRTHRDPLALAQGLRATVWSLDKDMPIADLATMEEMIGRKSAGRRAQTLLLLAFAALALCLAAVGIYGVVSEAVNQRTPEIGLRMALGAAPGVVLRMVMRRSFVLSLAGVAAGLAAGAYLVRYLAAQLFEVKPGDPITFASSALVLLAVALLAAYLPARRAVRIDPVAALRCE